jgi:hypothetical protein
VQKLFFLLSNFFIRQCHNSLKVQGHNSLNVQGHNSLNGQGHNSLNGQGHNSLYSHGHNSLKIEHILFCCLQMVWCLLIQIT